MFLAAEEEKCVVCWVFCSYWSFFLVQTGLLFLCVMVAPDSHCPALTSGMEKVKTLKHFPPYGSINGISTSDTCPTCRGTGRIPRGWFSAVKCNVYNLKKEKKISHSLHSAAWRTTALQLYI